MKLGITRWKVEPRNPNPFSPVQRARKFSEVLGTTSVLNSIITLPTGCPPAVTSKKTRGQAIFYEMFEILDDFFGRVIMELRTDVVPREVAPMGDPENEPR